MPGTGRADSWRRRPRVGGALGFPGPYGYPVAGPIVYGVGRGGISYGGGRGGWRMAAWDYPPAWQGMVPPPVSAVTPEDELEYLKQEEASLREALDQIRRRVEELESASGSQ